jgi:RNA-binding protein
MLTAVQRQELKGQAHSLKPVVMIGDKGLVDTVMAEIDRALKVHELIKIRVLSDEREERANAMAQICKAVGCEPVQIIGKLLVIFRARTEEETAERARLKIDRAKRARIRESAKLREAAEKAAPQRAATRSPARSTTPATRGAGSRVGPARTPAGFTSDGRQTKGVNSRVTRGAVSGAFVRTERAPRPSNYTPAPARNATPAARPARTSRPPRKSGY